MKELDIEIRQAAPENIGILLTESQGVRIREMIVQTNPSFPSYIRSVGLAPNNAYAILAGQRKVSLKVLRKLLSGTNVRMTCNLDVYLEKVDGKDAHDVDSAELEDSLFSEEQEEWEDRLVNPQTSSFSEKVQEAKRITRGNPSSESQDDS